MQHTPRRLGEKGTNPLPMIHGIRPCNPVCVYHACFPQVPSDVERKLHNITPSHLWDHLSCLKKCYRLVCVDELVECRHSGGVAAITFDDGYKSVITHALPVLADLDIPFTIFINSVSFDKRIFWRDKVRYIINHDLVKHCEVFLQKTSKIPGMSFYRYTKHPANNSMVVDQEITEFLQSRGEDLSNNQYCFEDTGFLLEHPLISYGNHSHNHYVLSSLLPEEQFQEIHQTHEFLASIANIRISGLFAVPFGDVRDYDWHTLAILKELGYSGVLLSRQRLDCEPAHSHGLAVIERFMPRGFDMATDLLALANAQPGNFS
jgi:peptidoglycan/xylan/chitin deacetylase (PgdA/CDA1 family)